MTDTYNHPGGKLRRLGPNQCTDKELLAIIINSGTKKYSSEMISEMILHKFGGINNLSGRTLKDLMDIEGIGLVKATQIAALFELTKRIIRNLETR